MSKSANKRLAKEQVKKLLARILHQGGNLRFTDYCEKRMLERGIVRDAEEYTHEMFIQWRYRIETNRYRVVVTFEVENEVVVINAIDFSPHLSTTKKRGD